MDGPIADLSSPCHEVKNLTGHYIITQKQQVCFGLGRGQSNLSMQ